MTMKSATIVVARPAMVNLLRAAHYLAATHGDLPFKARFEIDGDEAKG